MGDSWVIPSVTPLTDRSVCSISSIFDKCLMLQQTQSWPNYTYYRNFHFNEFFAIALRDNIGPQKNQPLTSEKNEVVFLGSG